MEEINQVIVEYPPLEICANLYQSIAARIFLGYSTWLRLRLPSANFGCRTGQQNQSTFFILCVKGKLDMRWIQREARKPNQNFNLSRAAFSLELRMPRRVCFSRLGIWRLVWAFNSTSSCLRTSPNLCGLRANVILNAWRPNLAYLDFEVCYRVNNRPW